MGALVRLSVTQKITLTDVILMGLLATILVTVFSFASRDALTQTAQNMQRVALRVLSTDLSAILNDFSFEIAPDGSIGSIM